MNQARSPQQAMERLLERLERECGCAIRPPAGTDAGFTFTWSTPVRNVPHFHAEGAEGCQTSGDAVISAVGDLLARYTALYEGARRSGLDCSALERSDVWRSGTWAARVAAVESCLINRAEEMERLVAVVAELPLPAPIPQGQAWAPTLRAALNGTVMGAIGQMAAGFPVVLMPDQTVMGWDEAPDLFARLDELLREYPDARGGGRFDLQVDAVGELTSTGLSAGISPRTLQKVRQHPERFGVVMVRVRLRLAIGPDEAHVAAATGLMRAVLAVAAPGFGLPAATLLDAATRMVCAGDERAAAAALARLVDAGEIEYDQRSCVVPLGCTEYTPDETLADEVVHLDLGAALISDDEARIDALLPQLRYRVQYGSAEAMGSVAVLAADLMAAEEEAELEVAIGLVERWLRKVDCQRLALYENCHWMLSALQILADVCTERATLGGQPERSRGLFTLADQALGLGLTAAGALAPGAPEQAVLQVRRALLPRTSPDTPPSFCPQASSWSVVEGDPELSVWAGYAGTLLAWDALAAGEHHEAAAMFDRVSTDRKVTDDARPWARLGALLSAGTPARYDVMRAAWRRCRTQIEDAHGDGGRNMLLLLRIAPVLIRELSAAGFHRLAEHISTFSLEQYAVSVGLDHPAAIAVRELLATSP